MSNSNPFAVPQMAPPQAAQRQPKWSLADTQEISCAVCGNQTFREAMYLRKVSKILTGDQKDTMLNIPVLSCDKCGYAIQELLPPELKSGTEPVKSV